MEAIVDLPEWIQTPRNRRFLKARRTLQSVVDRLIQERRALGAAGPDDFLTALLRAFDAKGDIDTRQLRDEVLTMFIAGFETVASALAWSIWMLATHPEWQNALRREASSTLGGRMPTLADLERLSVARMVADETMRLHPPAWWIVRSTIESDVIGGYAVPAGALIIVSQYVTHRHPQLWPDPERFDPGRFAAVQRPELAFFPFGDGPRSCIGEGFAYLQIKLILAMLVQRYRFTPLAGHRVNAVASATMRPRDGVPVFLQKVLPAMQRERDGPQGDPM